MGGGLPFGSPPTLCEWAVTRDLGENSGNDEAGDAATSLLV